MSYYHTCPYCKANLDPGEQCDCKNIQSPISDRLIIGFDNAVQYGDHTCLTISRDNIDQIEILACYYDDEAREMYSKLITQAPQGKIKII